MSLLSLPHSFRIPTAPGPTLINPELGMKPPEYSLPSTTPVSNLTPSDSQNSARTLSLREPYGAPLSIKVPSLAIPVTPTEVI